MLIATLIGTCWLLGGALTHASNCRLAVKTFEQSFDGLDPDDHNVRYLVWRFTWADLVLGPLLLTRNGEVWAAAWASFFVNMTQIELDKSNPNTSE